MSKLRMPVAAHEAAVSFSLGLVTLVIVAVLAVLIQVSPAQAGKVNASFLGSVAIEGSDPVAYFTEQKAVEGLRSFSFDWDGATWRFASAKNRDLFAAAPETFAPQYGGYCAWAVSKGYTAKIDPEAWRVVDGKLYLNYSKGVQRQWVQDIPGNIAQADKNWPGIKAGL